MMRDLNSESFLSLSPSLLGRFTAVQGMLTVGCAMLVLFVAVQKMMSRVEGHAPEAEGGIVNLGVTQRGISFHWGCRLFRRA